MRDLLLYLSTPLLMAIFAVTFFVLWNRDRARTSNLALGTGWALLCSAMLISQLSPSYMGRALVAITHVPYTLSAVCLASGLIMRVNVAPPVRSFLGVGLGGICAMALTQSVGDSIKADLLITNVTAGIIMVMATQSFAQAGKEDGVDRFMLVMMIVITAQFFIRPLLAFTFDGPIAAETYRDSIYYMTLTWIFGFGSVLFGLAQVAASVSDQINALQANIARDELSGLLARSEFERQVDEAIVRANADGTKLSLIVSDLDHFKQVNDIWGHQIGDETLARFGMMIRRMVRGTDIAGRIGGEEFCILVLEANEGAAVGLAERLRAATQALEVSKDTLDVRLTASFGVAERQHGESYHSLFARADKALYSAKEQGRNRVDTDANPATADFAHLPIKAESTTRLAG